MSQPAQRPGRRQARPAFRLTALALALCCAGPLWADPAAGKAGIHLQQPAQPLGQALSQLAAEGREGCDFHVGSGHSAGWLAARTWQLLTPQEVCDFPDAHRRG